MAGAAVSLGFLPWIWMHDRSDPSSAIWLGLVLSLGFLVLLALTLVPPLVTYLETLTLAAYMYCLTIASVILVLLPDGFLYGVGTLLSFTVVATVIAVDLTRPATGAMAAAFLLIPNTALLVSGEPWLTIMNTNWILVSGGCIAFGLAFLMDQSNRNTFLLEHKLAIEKERGDALLTTLLPSGIAQRLQESDEVIADIQDATVLFADLVGFTRLSRSLSPEELINVLTGVFTELDELVQKHGLEKIKTIGDSYMVAAGVADARATTAMNLAGFAQEALESVQSLATPTGARLEIRIGMASGPVVSGVIGRRRPYMDLWGTTVNLASRLESTAPAGGIQVDRETAKRLAGQFTVAPHGPVSLPGIGEVETYLLTGRIDPSLPGDPITSTPVSHPSPIED